MKPEARVIVIGGGPAGSALAFGLARRGVRVALCEARRFPRAKVCGEFLSPAAVAALDELVGVARLREAGARVVRDIVVEVGEREARYRLKQPGLALSRETLDALLLQRACESGVEVRQPALVRRVELRDGGAIAHLSSGEAIAADAVAHADGSGALDPVGPIPRRRDALAFKRHFTMRPGGAAEGVRMRACAGAYVGAAQVEGALATCALIASRRVVQLHQGDAAAILRAALPAPQADAMLRSDARDSGLANSRWLACGGPGSRLIAGGHPRSFRIGDAAAGIEPIAGEGIAFALHSGLTLARSFEPANPQRTHTACNRAMRRWLSVRRFAARAAGELFIREKLARTLWPSLRIPAASVGLWCALTGK